MVLQLKTLFCIHIVYKKVQSCVLILYQYLYWHCKFKNKFCIYEWHKNVHWKIILYVHFVYTFCIHILYIHFVHIIIAIVPILYTRWCHFVLIFCIDFVKSFCIHIFDGTVFFWPNFVPILYTRMSKVCTLNENFVFLDVNFVYTKCIFEVSFCILILYPFCVVILYTHFVYPFCIQNMYRGGFADGVRYHCNPA